MTDDLTGAPPPRILQKLPIADPEEILVLTYTSDLPFFEDVCVRQARARGARVTIVYDAGHVEPGFAAGGGPLTDYVPVPVQCRSGGAFHPKLLVAASADDALISIGSGNATSAGWHHNAELWTHLRIDGPTIPTLVEDLAAWLRRLPDRLWMEPLGAQRLHRVADLLTTRPSRPEPNEPWLITNDQVPIMDQLPLPDHPVDRLVVASPFFDPPADTLTTLITRLRPDSLDILLTRDAQLDSGRFERALDRVGTVRIAQPRTSRYHHGKALEWWSGPAGVLVTGSANCTRAALLRSMDDDRGNCELALLQEIAESVVDLVDAEEKDLDDLLLRDSDRETEPTPAIRVLTAQILTDPDRIEITILVTAGAAPDHLLIDVAGETHTAIHAANDDAIHIYRLDRSPGSLPRSVTVRDDSGVALGAALVTDVHSALARVRHPSPLEQQSLPELLGSEEQMQALLDALRRLAEIVPPRPDEEKTSLSRRRRRARVEEDIRRAVGSGLLNLALGRDRNEASAGGPDGGELKGDEGEPDRKDREQPASKSVTPPLSAAAAFQAQTENQRMRGRAWFRRLVEEAAEWPLGAQLASYRSLLIAVGGGLWPYPQEWAWLVHDGLENLWAAAEDESLAVEHGALAVIGLLAIRHGTLSQPDDPDLAAGFKGFLAAFRDWRDWALDVNLETIEKYAYQLSGHTLGPRFTAVNIRSDLEWLLARREIDDALDQLDDISDSTGLTTDGTVVVQVRRNPKRAVLLVLDRLREFPDTHVIAHFNGEVHGWWNGRRLLLAWPTPTGWRASVWHNLFTGIVGYAGSSPLPAASESATVTDPAEAWTRFGSR
ncbi:hypothetical protein [Actinoplanes rectilineatus]|uniref:hypothetical protein n=1 Tax=Actinoplanes rectilineatus TaxID=113571 RepID=UPI000B26A312|nr:hypothetical protein [Actinoplanes rectilineatus]